MYRMELLNEWLKLNRNNKIYKTIRDEFNNKYKTLIEKDDVTNEKIRG